MHDRLKGTLFAATAMGLAGTVLAPPARAEEAMAARGETALGEVVVTATRRETDLQKTPVAVTAFTGEALERSAIRSVADLQFSVPGLVFSQNGTAFTTLRGVGTSQPGSAVEAGVATNIDGVFVGRVSSVQNYFDLAGIEVLRGPQGTLYGRNATGGAINITSKRPEREFGAGGLLTVGNYDLRRVEAYVNVPLGATAAARLSVLNMERDSYLTNLTGQTVKGETAHGYRGYLEWTPTERLTLDVIADYLRSTGAGQVSQNLNGGIHPMSPVGTRTTTRADAIFQTYPNYVYRENWGLNATAELELDVATLKSITGYREAIWRGQNGLSATTDPTAFIPFDEGSNQFSQELQVLSPKGSRATWVAGIYHFREEVDASYAPEFLISRAAPLYDRSLLNQVFTNTSWAVYGQLTYPLTERLRVTAGARYTRDHKEGTGGGSENIFFRGAPPFLVIPTPVSVDKRWKAFTPKVGVELDLSDDALLYASATRGYKSGNSNLTFMAPPVRPEYVWSYVAGVKSRFLDNRLQVNAEAYYAKYTDMQVFALQQGGSTVTALFINAAKADMKGFDVEVLARPMPRLQLSGSYAYLDARFIDFPGAVDSFLNASAPAADRLKDNRLPRAPKHTVNVAAQYEADLGGGWRLTPRVEYAYRSRVYFSQFNHIETSQGGFALVNARVTLAEPSGRWTLAAFGRNLTDKDYLEYISEANGGGVPPGNVVSGFYAAPRTYGLELRARF
ncbi:MAG: TonB-dependent receptor [Phenylobacterium sp.]|uniref:TonB-dependent receptor n=1 Tax=Phenylobacterium sp. TaxID=1871053 RepID=UPI001A618E75|nr:TonB-dependent receptor [Phenylobacterium sp.]MBL8773333.1 TonB-dependent receptor [Phenylobacterium sp.]